MCRSRGCACCQAKDGACPDPGKEPVSMDPQIDHRTARIFHLQDEWMNFNGYVAASVEFATISIPFPGLTLRKLMAVHLSILGTYISLHIREIMCLLK